MPVTKEREEENPYNRRVTQGLKTKEDDPAGGVAAIFKWQRSKTPGPVYREQTEKPRGLMRKKPDVGEQRKRGFVIPDTPRRLNYDVAAEEGSVAEAMKSWKFSDQKLTSIPSRSTAEAKSDDPAIADLMANKYSNEADKADKCSAEKKAEQTTARGTQTTASVHRQPRYQKKVLTEDTNGHLWKMSKFTKNAKPMITTRRSGKK